MLRSRPARVEKVVEHVEVVPSDYDYVKSRLRELTNEFESYKSIPP